jgi:hypothetical protein
LIKKTTEILIRTKITDYVISIDFIDKILVFDSQNWYFHPEPTIILLSKSLILTQNHRFYEDGADGVIYTTGCAAWSPDTAQRVHF